MSHGIIHTSFWSDNKVRAWPIEAKLLAAYFITGPHRNILGCARIPDGYIIADLGWNADKLARAIHALTATDFVMRDDDGWTLVLNQLKHDPLKHANHIKGAANILARVPAESPVYQAAHERLASAAKALGIPLAGVPEPIPAPAPIPLPLTPTPTQVDAPQAAPADRGARLSIEVLPDDWKQFCLEKRPDLDPSATFDRFRDHWIAAPGQRGVKRDWAATWRNWVRNERPSPRAGPVETDFDRRLKAEIAASKAHAG